MEGYAGVQTLDRLGEHPTHGYLLKKIKNDDGSFVVRDDVFVSYIELINEAVMIQQNFITHQG
jgi:hypothetical protein